METNEAEWPTDAPAPERAKFPWAGLRVCALSVALVAAPFLTGLVPIPEGAPYSRLERDHDELMVSRTGPADRAVTVLFIGNSLTFRNDLPAMLVDLASSDPGNPVRLQVKADTRANARLDDMLAKPGVLAWAQEHRADYVVLQEHSLWYDDDYAGALGAFSRWRDALRPLGETPVLFQLWGEGEGNVLYTDQRAVALGFTPAEQAQKSAEVTQRLAGQLGLSVVAVGQAFEAARQTQGAPDLYGPDHHHPSVAGTYLAALVFYRFLTGRTGAEATYRPIGLSARDAAALVQLNGG